MSKGVYTDVEWGGRRNAQLENSKRDHTASGLYGSEYPQSTLTFVAKPHLRDIVERYTSLETRGRYPYGSDPTVHFITEYGLVFAKRKSQSLDTAGQYIECFQSVNGMDFEGCKTVEELERKHWLVGLSRSNVHTIKSAQAGSNGPSKTGFAVMAFGTATLRQKFLTEIYPGDLLMWSFPDSEITKNVMTHRDTERHNKKLNAVVEAVDWTIIDNYLANIARLVLRKGNDMGISKNLLNFGDHDVGATKPSASPKVKTANALKTHVLFVGSKFTEVLITRGILNVNTPYNRNVNDAKDALLTALFKSNYKGMDGNNRVDTSGMNPNDASVPLIETYNAYIDALQADKTDIFTGENIDLDEEVTKSYTYHTSGVHLASKMRSIGQAFSNTNDAQNYLESEKMQKHLKDVMYIPYLVGLVDGRGERKVVYDVLNACLPSYATYENKKLYRTGDGIVDLSKILTREQEHILSAYKHFGDNHLLSLGRTLSDSQEAVRSKIFGRAMSHGTPTQLEGAVSIILGGFKF